MKVPIMNLAAQNRPLEKKIQKAISNTIKGYRFILGEEVKMLEENIASYCGVKYAVGVNSGTDALILGLEACGVKADDEVITTPFTFFASVEAIIRVGAKPVFADIDPRTYNIDPCSIANKITKKTKAVLPVHIFGLPAEMDIIVRLAKKHNLKIIEDCAQAIGSEYKSLRVGSMGDAGCLSFFPSKNLGCCGDGGMIITSDKSLTEKVRLLRNHGSPKKYSHDIIGHNSRLDNMQAAILNVKLKCLNSWIGKRIQIAEYYRNALKGLPVTTPFKPSYSKHTYHLYTLKINEKYREKLLKHLENKEIEARVYYGIPMHMQKALKFLDYKKGDFPVSEEAGNTTFAIPLYPELKESEKQYVVSNIREFFK